MANWNQGIDGKHLTIAGHVGSAMRVLAGPGTGKSYAIQRKVMRLLEEGQEPGRILAVTFTNVAADALKKDLNVGVPGAEKVRACTLHSLCFEILQKEKVLQITNRNPRPLMDFETDILLEDLKEQFGGKRKVEKLLFAFESAFARQQQDTPGVITTPEDAKFKHQLMRWLNAHRAILIGELVPLTYEYLRNNPMAPELGDYDYVLVDEYQDLNKAEQMLTDLLAAKAELLVVGDDDQSIYSFKHAHPEGIIEFPGTHIPSEDVGLKVCRRCPKKVVNLANELMGYLLGENPKKLEEFPANKDGEVYAAQWQTMEDETKGIAQLIKKMCSNTTPDSIKPEEVLVLAPRRQIGYALRDELQNTFSIPAHTFFQEEALDTLKAQRAYTILNYVASPEDRVALRSFLAMPTPLPSTYDKILEKAEELNTTPKEVILQLRSGSIRIPNSAEIIKRFDELESIQNYLEGKPVTEIVSHLFDVNDPVDIEVLLSIVNNMGVAEDDDPRKFFLRLQDRIRSPEVTEDEGFVKIMSLHKSKGLTSRVVFILGCCAGLLPFIKDEEKLIKENRTSELDRLRSEAKRLFFVAITRTNEYLILSSFRQIDFGHAKRFGVKITRGPRGVRLAQTQASPFFSEVSKHLPRVTTGRELLSKFDVILATPRE